jgi:hypothetical protein
MEKLKQEFAAMNSDKSNPYMQCLAELLDPPTKVYVKNLVQYYESLVPSLHGKKKEAAEKILASLKKKNITSL